MILIMKKVKLLAIVIAGCAIICLITVLLCDYLVRSNAEGKLYTNVDEIPETEVGLLLGTTPQTRIGRRQNQFFKFRIDGAEALYKAGKIKKILISGDDNSLDGINEVEVMKDTLVQRGVPEECFILDGKGYRTLDAVVRASKRYGFDSYTVISQQFHNERAIYLAEHLTKAHDLVGYNAKDATSNMAMMTYIREYLARVKVFVDLLTGKQPKVFFDDDDV